MDFRCWNSSEAVTGPMEAEGLPLSDQGHQAIFLQINSSSFHFFFLLTGFVQVWTRFQDKARKLVEKINPGIQEHILWTSTLTHKEFIEAALPSDYIVQIWTNAKVSYTEIHFIFTTQEFSEAKMLNSARPINFQAIMACQHDSAFAF